MSSNATKDQSLQTLFAVIKKRSLSKPSIVSMISLDFDAPGSTDVFKIMLGLESSITRLI